MKRFKIFALTTAVTVGLTSTAFAADGGANFTSHHLVPKEDYAGYAEQLPADNKIALRQYLDYEDREQCQGYQRPPEGFIEEPNNCDLGYRQARQQRVAVVRTTNVPEDRMAMRPVVSDYEIHFDFDEAQIRPTEQNTLERVVQDIQRVNPYEVTVVGHADRAGPQDYNVALSQDRAQSVSQALTQRGIPNRILDKRALGEQDPAVPTNDGVRLEENRRVEVQFRK